MGGPVETSMVVFGDIWSYKSGVYKCGNKKGGSGHSIVLIGFIMLCEKETLRQMKWLRPH